MNRKENHLAQNEGQKHTHIYNEIEGNDIKEEEEDKEEVETEDD